MLRRKIEDKIQDWIKTDYGLLVDGARQIGKTFIIRKCINQAFEDVVEINLLENKKAVEVLSGSTDASDFILRLTSLVKKPLVKGKTVIFIDEIQEFKDFDIITMMKFLVEMRKYRFVLSGSLLGVEQYGIASWPEGYMILEKMYPMDFEEFLWANGVSEEIIKIVQACYKELCEVPDYIHDLMMDQFKKYLLVGGMPKAVQTFVDTKDFNMVAIDHQTINQYISKDVSKYAFEQEKVLIKTMYDLIPSELNKQNKRFSLKDIPRHNRKENLGLSFGWFTKAGVAIPTYNVKELNNPLELNSNHSLVKLFHEDVGILTYKYMNPEIKQNIMIDASDINFGAIYENAVAQMFTASGHEKIYYYSKNGIGELDFVLQQGLEIIPIEVKSGKSYARHSAINNALKQKNITRCYVLNNGNLKTKNEIIYLPIYMAMYL